MMTSSKELIIQSCWTFTALQRTRHEVDSLLKISESQFNSDCMACFIMKFLNKELWQTFSTLESRIVYSWPQMKRNHRLKLILFIWWEIKYLLLLWILILLQLSLSVSSDTS